MSLSYAVYRDLAAQAIRNDSAISSLVDDEIHTSGNTTINDSWLNPADPTSHHCCIVVTSQNCNSIPLPGVAYHGISDNDHLMRISVIQDQADSDTYAADVAIRIKNLIEKSITVTMNAVTYTIGFSPPIKTFSTSDSNFPNRIFVILDFRAKYLG